MIYHDLRKLPSQASRARSQLVLPEVHIFAGKHQFTVKHTLKKNRAHHSSFCDAFLDIFGVFPIF